MVQPWTKKPHLHPLPHPLLPIWLVVATSLAREHELQLLKLERVAVFFPCRLHDCQLCLAFLVADVECPGAIDSAPVAFAVALVQTDVLAAAALAFPFPVGRHNGRTQEGFDTMDSEIDSDACATELLRVLHRGSQLDSKTDCGG